MSIAMGDQMFVQTQTPSTILCCDCGVSIFPNPFNMCGHCVGKRIDITGSLSRRRQSIDHCPDCKSFLLRQHSGSWFRADLESKELLAVLLSHLKHQRGLNKLHLLDAKFIWTEPHSKRIKLKLWVRAKVSVANNNGGGRPLILEQTPVVEFTIHDSLCSACSRFRANPDQWAAKVQLRQDVPHRRTFFYLEQLILKHNAADKAVRIQETNKGVDFMFAKDNHAEKFVSFVAGAVPLVGNRSDKRLVSHDTKSNTYNFRRTFSLKICPICREDLFCLPPNVSNRLGGLGPLVICTKVTKDITLMDPFTLRTVLLDARKYSETQFPAAMLSSRQLVEYIVLDVEKIESPQFVVDVNGSKYCLAYVQVARLSDFGKNDKMFTVRTHLGHLLNPGDYALGYDLYGANFNDVGVENLSLPDVILIKKSYEQERQRGGGKPRAWKLKSLNIEADPTPKGRVDAEKRDDEYEEFLKDLEENPDLRFNISLYHDEEYQQSDMASSAVGGDDDLPIVLLDELLADLRLSDDNETDTDTSMME